MQRCRASCCRAEHPAFPPPPAVFSLRAPVRRGWLWSVAPCNYCDFADTRRDFSPTARDAASPRSRVPTPVGSLAWVLAVWAAGAGRAAQLAQPSAASPPCSHRGVLCSNFRSFVAAFVLLTARRSLGWKYLEECVICAANAATESPACCRALLGAVIFALARV